jgi:hypothetical protein
MAVANGIDPDLQAFKARGGKLLIYHGWSDQLIPPENSINYYSSVLAKMGSKQDNFVRLFMAPGMQHCGGGAGPNQINYVAALERWRESNTAPDQLIASRVVNNRVDMTRPLCPYPQVVALQRRGQYERRREFRVQGACASQRVELRRTTQSSSRARAYTNQRGSEGGCVEWDDCLETWRSSVLPLLHRCFAGRSQGPARSFDRLGSLKSSCCGKTCDSSATVPLENSP